MLLFLWLCSGWDEPPLHRVFLPDRDSCERLQRTIAADLLFQGEARRLECRSVEESDTSGECIYADWGGL